MSAVRTNRSARRRTVRSSGTLPPEGSGAAMDRDHALPVRQWPITLVFVVVGLGLVVTWAVDFRYGLLVLGAGFGIGALLRLLVPEVGLLAVRSRFTDVLVLLFFGTAIVLLALVAPQNPWLHLPALENIGKYVGRQH
ncbi:DUF3017 domain-containing protein [Kitasatospora viridis]|uniref:DUF3017 family protein n=1 Tax=Kitasatospora viridis TaxID=281105 RepID=A0A561UJM6_9ACTN|nr:DUF3017 domain-containing protein [Kitasatospora viridis]TWF99570.1 DUF3017 family protein [Kitasatospora viridis]